MKTTKAEREKAITDLRELLKPGDTIWTVLRHVSRSGMSRAIDCYLLHDGDRDWLSYRIAKACGIPFSDKRDALTVGGCGMDMGFHTVYTLSRVLFPNGFGCIGGKLGHLGGCPSNDHSNGDRDYTPDDPGDIRWTEGSEYKAPHKHWHRDGGYALKHKWL
jgi:hypothetical protein